MKIKNPFPPAKHDFHKSASLAYFASNASTNTMIAGHSSKDFEFFTKIFILSCYTGMFWTNFHHTEVKIRPIGTKN